MQHDPLAIRLHSRSQYYLDQAAKHFALQLPSVTLHFNLRGRSAGRASRRLQDGVVRYTIAYNVAMISDHLDTLDNTVGHEVAHVINWILHGSKINPHGAEWRMIMTIFELNPLIYHNYPMRSHYSRLRYWLYRCRCHEALPLSSLRHNRVQRGERQYLCRQCREPLQWTGRRA